MVFLELLGGIALLAIASAIFWRVGQENVLNAKWRSSLGMECLLVFVVLGGWAGGASFLIHGASIIVAR